MAASSFSNSPLSFFNEFKPRFISSFMKKFPAVRREEIEDLYQDTYIIVSQQYSEGKTKEDTNWWAYISTVGFNQMSKRFRGKTAVVVSIDSSDDSGMASPFMIEMEETVNAAALGEPSAEEIEEKYGIMEEVLASFPEKTAAILSDKYILKLSDKEIAEKRGYANAATVKAKRCQLLKKAKELCRQGAA